MMDIKRKRLLFHCTHMGMKENDVLFGSFAVACVAHLSDRDVEDLETLLKNNDMDLFHWASAKVEVPREWKSHVMRQIIQFNADRV